MTDAVSAGSVPYYEAYAGRLIQQGAACSIDALAANVGRPPPSCTATFPSPRHAVAKHLAVPHRAEPRVQRWRWRHHGDESGLHVRACWRGRATARPPILDPSAAAPAAASPRVP